MKFILVYLLKAAVLHACFNAKREI